MGIVNNLVHEFKYDLTPKERGTALLAAGGAVALAGTLVYVGVNFDRGGPACDPNTMVDETYYLVVEEGGSLSENMSPGSKPNYMSTQAAIAAYREQNGITNPGDIYPGQSFAATLPTCPEDILPEDTIDVTPQN